MKVNRLGFVAVVLVSGGVTAVGCGSDDTEAPIGTTGSTTTAATTTTTGGTTSSSGGGGEGGAGSTGSTTASTTTASTGGGEGGGTTTGTTTGGGEGGAGGGGDPCAPAPGDDPCTACAKTSCCDEGQACFAEASCAACAACLQTSPDPFTCIQNMTCNFQDPTTSAFLQCVQGSCGMQCM